MRGADPTVPDSRRRELLERFQLDPTKKGGRTPRATGRRSRWSPPSPRRTELLILDEPTSGLDPLMEQVFNECVAEHTAAGATVLLSSHILSEVETTGQPGDDHPRRARRGVRVAGGDAPPAPQQACGPRVGPVPDLAAIAGVHDVAVEGQVVSGSVDAEAMPAVLAALTAAGVQNLTSTPPSLEELFLDVYRTDPAGRRR